MGIADLRILRISDEPVPMAHPARYNNSPRSSAQVIARGRDGVTVSEVVNLWKGSWAVGKGVTDVEWGAGGQSIQLVDCTR